MEKVIYSFWTGDNEMSPDRVRSLRNLQSLSKCEVVLVTTKDLHRFEKKEYPIHESYEHLTFTHRADYLRCYFMHIYGGGYSDVKAPTNSWESAFEDLNATSFSYVNGYRELNPDCIADAAGYEFSNAMKMNYDRVVGCSAFICKPQTPFTKDWFEMMHKKMDFFSPYLKANPGVYPQEQPGMLIDGKISRYPLRWAEILGTIWHPLCIKYSYNLLQTLPVCNFSMPYR